MKKTRPVTGTISLWIMILVLGIATACGKKTPSLQFSFTSHKDGDVVSRPLPLAMKGTIVNYHELDGDARASLHLYLVEQSTRERIWHIEPEGTVSDTGEWSAITWLGNPRQGNRNVFNVCVFAVDEPLELRDGDHPVDSKPESLGEACITLKRRDR